MTCPSQNSISETAQSRYARALENINLKECLSLQSNNRLFGAAVMLEQLRLHLQKHCPVGTPERQSLPLFLLFEVAIDMERKRRMAMIAGECGAT